MIVTIDGPAGAGKSTVARAVAGRLDLPYLNSGYLYRAVTLLVLEEGEGRFDDRARVEELIRTAPLRLESAGDGLRVWLGDRDVTELVTSPRVTSEVWRVANDGGYRALLVDRQRAFAVPDGVVAEGRDMGTVIFPEADCKIYLDAGIDERARRRLRDLEAAGEDVPLTAVRASIEERDAHDRGRDVAPLRVPDGAEVVPTDGLGVAEVVDRVVACVRRATEEA